MLCWVAIRVSLCGIAATVLQGETGLALICGVAVCGLAVLGGWLR